MLVKGVPVVEVGISREDYTDTMAADALVPCVVRWSTAEVLNISDMQVLVFHQNGFNHRLNLSVQGW